ncbi:GIY-YIG nuclease family protein [Pseudomonas syringae]|uniref:GIY-YIG nuclease family protein n=1 Tax=Pseudomonas syringae TaxID=317 RepID=UPI001BCED21B|nr:GIY-YIG nuclease family protein [Pseudomonas syringae]MBS7422639.1 GIY-YIG nuclease family protein [Pseudomonas syringae]QVK32329.1 GIY-YIG nuclease family protein [Pseudomonas syringae]
MAIDENWEDQFDPDDYDDYKTAAIEKERFRQQNSKNGWIYVGMDARSPDEAKIGLTSNGLSTRASSSHNRRYVPYCAFKVKEGVSKEEIKAIETSTITALSTHFERLPHDGTGKPSEWFATGPALLREVASGHLCENHSRSMDGYYCFDRDMQVIKSWENDRVLKNRNNKPYEASDLSNPPVAYECYLPGGCGAADCDCFD